MYSIFGLELTIGWYIVLFVVCQLINVALNTAKTIIMHKEEKVSSSIINAVTYGFYAIIVVMTASALPLWITIVITFITNLIGVYGSMWLLDKWKKEEIIRVFDDRFVIVFNQFKENIKSPILKIRDMRTRWGVYNRKNHTITLNAKLIEFDTQKIDYVIIHELSHIIHFNHSQSFWNLVSKYCKDYKKIRKEMKG